MRHLPLWLATAAVLAGSAFTLLGPRAGNAAADSAKVVGPPAVAWKDMTPQQKGKFMKEVVTPKMKPAFQTFDAELFHDFGCKTCHGKDPKAVKFKMPNPEIHPLPATPAAFQAKMQATASWPKWVKFMHEEVQPQMATLLGLPSFDIKKPAPGAFSCQACHTLEKSDPAAPPATAH